MTKAQPQTPPSISQPCDPEYIAIILAATQGARLFPLTSEYPTGVPKHLLPISPLNPSSSSSTGDDSKSGGGAPLLQRLLIKTYNSGFEMVVIAIHKEDNMTIPFLLGSNKDSEQQCSSGTSLCTKLSKENEVLVSTNIATTGNDSIVTDLEFHGLSGNTQSSTKKSSGKSQSSEKQRWMHVRVVRLPEECHGSADALRFLSKDNDQSDSSNNINSDTERQSDSNLSYIPRSSHAVVMPGDLILEGDLLTQEQSKTNNNAYDGKDVLSLLVQAHRGWNADGSTGSACTMLLTDVGAEDKEGIPLKESSKAKTGLISREEEDMEYIGLSSEVSQPLSGSLASISHSKSGTGGPTPSRRVVLKRHKIEVEEDEGTGSTPKLTVAKRRLHSSTGSSGRRGNTLAQLLGGNLSMSATATKDHSPTISLRTDLHDVHLYVISNWVFDLLLARPSMQSFQNEVLPLLISRQFRGVEAAFGPTAWKVEENRERLRKVLRDLDGMLVDRGGNIVCTKISTLLGMYASGKMSGGLGRFIPDEDVDDVNPVNDELGDSASFPTGKHPFSVSAQVLSREASSVTLRACTLPSLLYGCSEITSRTLKLDSAVSSSLVAKGAKLSTKYNSILMSGCSMGEKVQTKSSTIGKNVALGDKTKLNNVLVMDGVKIGSNVVLQNSVVGMCATIGDNCNLKDCQVGPGATVPSGTKTTEKGESLL